MACPDADLLQAYLEGGGERAAIRAHLEGCADCRALVLALSTAITRESRHTASVAEVQAVSGVPRGDRIGRYVVMSQLGAGGMGVVYSAYDPELDRKVALKVIRRVAGDTDETTQQLQARLVREAQAMAKLAHPNVCAVYDVGRHGDEVFVAMELVVGETVAEWLYHDRSRVEIVAVFTRAAAGLQAAHAAGMVHRDFKPNNVMIDSEGRVRVMDFGLARATGERGEDTAPSPRAIADARTATGALMGTPAYMAPEQLARHAADARTDQFSFCVALYEALCGTRPFIAPDTDELRATILRGELQAPRRRVPAWLLRVVARGLRADPAARFASMNELGAALEHDPTRRRWRALAALIVVAAVGGAALLARHAWRAQQQLCAGADRKLLGVWDEARRNAVAAAFEHSGVAYASGTFAAVAAQLDRYTRQWTLARTDACAATRLAGEQSEELLDLRMSCLDDRLAQTASLVELLSHADAATVEHAPEAAAALPSLTSCANAKLLRERVPPPRDPQARDQVTALRRRLHDLRARLDAAQLSPSLIADARTLVHDAARVAYAPIVGDARDLYADALDHDAQYAAAAEAYQAEVFDDERGHDDQAAGRAWLRYGYVVGVQENHPDEGLRWLPLGRAKLERVSAGADNERENELLLADAEALLLWAKNDDEPAAEAALKRAVALARSTHSPELASYVNNLAQFYEAYGHPEPGLPLAREALREAERQYGPEHPTTLFIRNGLGLCLIDAHQPADALPIFDATLAGWRRVHHDVDGPGEGHIMGGRATALVALGRYAEAIAEGTRAVTLIEALDPKDGELVDPLMSIGEAQLKLGNASAAVTAYQRARAIMNVGPHGALTSAEPTVELVRALWDAGDHAAAQRLARDEMAVFAHEPSPSPFRQKLQEKLRTWQQTHS